MDKAVVNAPEKQPFIFSIYEWIEVFCYALTMMVLIFLFVFKYVTVDGSSMYPTLNDNGVTEAGKEIEDRLIISNLFYTPESGDIVVIYSPGHIKPLIKRIIATEGQTVKIVFSKWQIFVDGVEIEQDYLIPGKNYTAGEIMNMGNFTQDTVEFAVAEDKVFVMGDNRQGSLDSRFASIGQLRIDDIIGRVLYRIYPSNKMGKVS